MKCLLLQRIIQQNKNRDHETDFYFQKDVCCRYSDSLSDGILFGNGTANAATQRFTRNKQ